ncbi:MAG: hypothetical protein U5J63_08780 [Fodinibius sp.]|nr:hypothetical protein [Fodinibius sp.]
MGHLSAMQYLNELKRQAVYFKRLLTPIHDLRNTQAGVFEDVNFTTVRTCPKKKLTSHTKWTNGPKIKPLEQKLGLAILCAGYIKAHNGLVCKVR